MSNREKLVHDELEDCPYLKGQLARMPLRWQLRRPTPEEFDDSLHAGDRRIGKMLYRTTCPNCTSCEPLRIPVNDFHPSRSMRRIIKKNKDIRVEIGVAQFSEEKLDLYNRHKQERNLNKREKPMNQRGYHGWFLNSCAITLEFRYLLEDRLVGLGIIDAGRKDTSSVYFFFDPDESARSLGTYSVLYELMWQQQRQGRFHYLGLYVEHCQHLVYKARFLPHERRVDGVWTRFSGK